MTTAVTENKRAGTESQSDIYNKGELYNIANKDFISLV